MSDNHFTGIWTVKKPEALGLFKDLKIEEISETGRFTLSDSTSGLHLPDLVYNAEDSMLIGLCQGRVRGNANQYNVAVMIYGDPPALKCKGVIFPANSTHREDNSVGTWTADKRGPTDPPPES